MNTKMKARIALTAYWLAIGFLVACAGVIVFKLMFWPLCTPAATPGNACVVGDSWTIAGITAAILGVVATVLAILGAFGVAAWWTGLEERVSKQITVLYEEQKEELFRTRKAMIHLRLGDRHLNQNLVNEALSNYNRAKELLKDDADLNYVLGCTLNDVGEYDEAITILKASHFEDTIEQARVHTELGIGYRRRWEHFKHDEDLEKAERHLKKAAELNGKDSRTFTLLGGLYRRKNDYEKALDWYNRALQINRNSSYPLGHIATLLWYLGRGSEAKIHFQETELAAIALIQKETPELYWFYYDLGLAQMAAGRTDEAKKSYKKAARMTPGKVQFDAILEDLYLLQGAPERMPGLDDIVKMLEDAKANM